MGMIGLSTKTRNWLVIIGRELKNPAILPENFYNMDETGVLSNVLSSLKILVGRDGLRNHRAVAVDCTLVTAIEFISANIRCIQPLIIWPAATHRSSWTSHSTPGSHYAYSKTGYTTQVLACIGCRVCSIHRLKLESISSLGF